MNHLGWRTALEGGRHSVSDLRPGGRKAPQPSGRSIDRSPTRCRRRPDRIGLRVADADAVLANRRRGPVVGTLDSVRRTLVRRAHCPFSLAD